MSFQRAREWLFAGALVGLGLLCGFAGAYFRQENVSLIAPLFANAIGAAVGASITLYFTEKRAQRDKDVGKIAKIEELANLLSLWVLYSSTISKSAQARNADGETLTALKGLLWLLDRTDSLFERLVAVGRSGLVNNLIHASAFAERNLQDMVGKADPAIVGLLTASGPNQVYAESFKKVAIAFERVHAEVTGKPALVTGSSAPSR